MRTAPYRVIQKYPIAARRCAALTAHVSHTAAADWALKYCYVNTHHARSGQVEVDYRGECSLEGQAALLLQKLKGGAEWWTMREGVRRRTLSPG